MTNPEHLQKALARVKKLLKLSRSDNEHEAAQAASKAAALIEEYQLSEASLRVEDDTIQAEPILERGSIEGEADDPVWKRNHKRVAWKGTIAGALADSLGARMWWDTNGQIRCHGRESAVQTWSYTCRYLFNEVDRLCHLAWDNEGEMAELAGQSARGWKNAFRVGAAVNIAKRLYEEKRAHEDVIEKRKEKLQKEAPQGSDCLALAVVERDAEELESEYNTFAKREKFRSIPSIGSTSSRSGFDAGREAGDRIKLGRTRGGLREGTRRIGKE